MYSVTGIVDDRWVSDDVEDGCRQERVVVACCAFGKRDLISCEAIQLWSGLAGLLNTVLLRLWLVNRFVWTAMM